MLAQMMTMMKNSGLDMESQAVKDQLQSFMTGLFVTQAKEKMVAEEIEKTKEKIKDIEKKEFKK